MDGLWRRQDENDKAFDAGQELLKLLEDPFAKQVRLAKKQTRPLVTTDRPDSSKSTGSGPPWARPSR